MRFLQACATSKTASTNETITRSETTETCHAHFPTTPDSQRRPSCLQKRTLQHQIKQSQN